MTKHQKFFICNICGNIIGLIDDHGGPMACCGADMIELVANTVDASVEKHVPAIEKTAGGIKVKVGSVLHPSEKEHYIDFIYVRTTHGGQRKRVNIGDAPELEFCFVNDEPIEVFAYCNLHGLWKAEV